MPGKRTHSKAMDIEEEENSKTSKRQKTESVIAQNDTSLPMTTFP